MAEKTVEKKRSAFLERVPELKNKKWGGMEIAAGEAVVNDILKGGKPAVVEIIGGLEEVDDGSDWKERLLLHMLVTQTSVPARAKEQTMLKETFLEAANGEYPGSVRAFVVQQARLFADRTAASKLAPLLHDDDPLVVDAAADAMVSIGPDARKSLEGAKRGAGEHAKKAIQHALHQIQ